MIAAVPVVVLGWLVVAVVKFATSDYPLGGGPEKVPCAEALAFGGARLPEGAYEGKCTVQAWQDTAYHATFRMPRADVGAWLRSTYPAGPKPTTELCDEGADLCVNMNTDGTVPPGVDADAVQIDVTYEDPATARVTFTAFTV